MIIEREGQRLDIGVRVHIDVERRLRHADFDLRPPIGDVRPRRRAGIEVEDVADVVGELFDISEIGACCAGIRWSGSAHRSIRWE